MEKELEKKKCGWDNLDNYEKTIIALPPIVCLICFMPQVLYSAVSDLTALGIMLMIVVIILTLCAVLFLIFVPTKLNVENYDVNLLAKWRSEKDEMLFLGAAVGSLLLAVFQTLEPEWLSAAFSTITPKTCVFIKIGSVIVALYFLLLIGIRYRCLSEGIILQENEAKKMATQYHVQIERANN